MSEKKNVSLIVLDILKKHSSKDSPLSARQILEVLKNDYGRCCDKRTVISAIKSLSELGYLISEAKNAAKKSSWFILPAISKQESDRLFLALISSECIDKTDFENTVEALSDEAPCDEMFLNIKRGNNDNSDILLIIRSLSLLNFAISENKMVSFSVIEYTKKGKAHLHKSDGAIQIYLVKPIEILAVYGEILLFCELGDTGIYRYFKIKCLYDVTVTKIKSQVSLLSTAPIPKNRLEATLAFPAKRENAILRVETDKLCELDELLGQAWEIVCSYGSKAEISVTTDLRLLKRYVLSLGTSVEVVMPTKLRRAVGAELREAAAKYNESRKLYGQL